MRLDYRTAGCRMLGDAGTIPILTYHSIDDSGSVLSTPVQTFRRHLATLCEMGLRTVSVSEIAACLRAGKAFPSRAVALTFDDGFASAYEHAFRLLCQYGFSATVFLVTGYCGRLNDWPGQPRGIARQPLLQWSQIQEMSRHGIQFGAHTKTHPDLRRLPGPELEREVSESKWAIEDRLGQAVDCFAYPYGNLNARVQAIVRQHFAAACSVELSFVQQGSHPLGLPRIDAYYLRPRVFPRCLWSSAGTGYLGLRRALRSVRRTIGLFPSPGSLPRGQKTAV